MFWWFSRVPFLRHCLGWWTGGDYEGELLLVFDELLERCLQMKQRLNAYCINPMVTKCILEAYSVGIMQDIYHYILSFEIYSSFHSWLSAQRLITYWYFLFPFYIFISWPSFFVDSLLTYPISCLFIFRVIKMDFTIAMGYRFAIFMHYYQKSTWKASFWKTRSETWLLVVNDPLFWGVGRLILLWKEESFRSYFFLDRRRDGFYYG